MRKPTKRKGIGGPFRGRARKAQTPVEEAPPEQPEVTLDTVEQVVSNMQALCDDVDEQMDKEQIGDHRAEHNFFHYYQNAQPWRSFHDRRDVLRERLTELHQDNEAFDMASFLRPRLMRVEPGAEPSWARPGFFVLWIGATMPVGCVWEGFIEPEAFAVAVDPARPWVEPSGQYDLGASIRGDFRTVADLFRFAMVTWTKATEFKKNIRRPTFRPVTLTPSGRSAAAQRLADNPWLRGVLNQGPVNPVPMPQHIRSVQMALMS